MARRYPGIYFVPAGRNDRPVSTTMNSETVIFIAINIQLHHDNFSILAGVLSATKAADRVGVDRNMRPSHSG